MTEADILETTYLDSCMIERIQDAEDPESGVTKQEYAPTHEKLLPCALSQSGLGASGNLSVVHNADVVNVTDEEYRLFLRPEVEIKKGDRITIDQKHGFKYVLYAKKPFYYPSHCEVNMTERDLNG